MSARGRPGCNVPKYTVDQVRQVLAAEGPTERIAREAGVAATTARQWREGLLPDHVEAAFAAEKAPARRAARFVNPADARAAR